MKKIFILFTALFVLLLPFQTAFAHNLTGYTGTSFKTINSSVGIAPWNTVKTGTWSVLDNTATYPYGSKLMTSTSGNYIEFEVETTDLQIGYYRLANAGGVGQVYVDGVSHGTFNTYSGGTTNIIDAHYDINNLTPGKHKIQIKAVGASGPNGVQSEVHLFGLEVKNYVAITHDEVSSLAVNPFHNEVNISFNVPNNPEYTGAKIYKNGSLLATLDSITNVYKDTAVTINTQYTYKVTATYSDGFETTGIVQTVTTPSAPADTTPPAEITNLQNTPYNDSIDFAFDNPVDLDFKHVNIYQNGVLIAQTANGSYTALNLTDSTTYNYKFATVDTSGNESAGVPLQVTTLSLVDTTPPDAPKNVSISNASNGGTVKWDQNTEKDLAGYNVYVNGVKDNTSLITNNSYSVIGLTVGSNYDITVTAVDKAGNESLASLTVVATPQAGSLPILKLGYELKDVSEGTGEMFGSIWLIVAFSVAIPLSFYISSRTKLLFLN